MPINSDFGLKAILTVYLNIAVINSRIMKDKLLNKTRKVLLTQENTLNHNTKTHIRWWVMHKKIYPKKSL